MFTVLELMTHSCIQDISWCFTFISMLPGFDGQCNPSASLCQHMSLALNQHCRKCAISQVCASARIAGPMQQAALVQHDWQFSPESQSHSSHVRPGQMDGGTGWRKGGPTGGVGQGGRRKGTSSFHKKWKCLSEAQRESVQPLCSSKHLPLWPEGASGSAGSPVCLNLLVLLSHVFLRLVHHLQTIVIGNEHYVYASIPSKLITVPPLFHLGWWICTMYLLTHC